MHRFYLLSLTFIILFVNVRSQGHDLIFIENGGTRAGILSDVGGRIVYLSYMGSENLLKSDSQLWYEDRSDKPEVSPFSSFKAYNGHIVWNGPQSEWWIHQDVNPERKKSKAVWPPDPWLIYGKYKVIEQDQKSVLLQGPASEVSGLLLKKYIEIDDEGRLYFEVEGINIRKSEIAWDLWLNTRVDGYVMAYVKTGNDPGFTIKSRSTPGSDTVRWNVKEGYFYYLPEMPSEEKQQRSSKAFLFPENNIIHAFVSDHYFSIEIPEVPANEIHLEHGMIEIYNFTSTNREEALTELEFHAPYKVLGPGESMKTWQKWRILPYKGEKKSGAHIRFLEENSHYY